jgi:hypothetical protein
MNAKLNTEAPKALSQMVQIHPFQPKKFFLKLSNMHGT